MRWSISTRQCTFGNNPVAPSIDTPLHGYLPFAHVDHLHPDWGIALAASANGKIKMEEFNQEFGHKLAWLPWQRPGFELGMMLRRIVKETPGCDGVVLGGHGLFTWGDTQRESYLSTITIIDQFGQFIDRHAQMPGYKLFGGDRVKPRDPDARAAIALGNHASPARGRFPPAAGHRQLYRRSARARLRRLPAGAGSSPTWAQAAPTTLSAPRSALCSSTGIPPATPRNWMS